MQNTKYKTIMCKYFSQDKPCPLGSRCHFSHGKEEIRKMNDPLPQNTPIVPGAKQIDPAGGTPVILNNYKTVVCKYWEQGKCKYLQKCAFAHGDSEVRTQDLGTLLNSGAILDPLKVPAFEYLLRQQQLEIICSEILENEKENKEAKELVQQATENLREWKINNAADILLKYIMNTDIDESSKKIRKTILEKSIKHGEIFLEKCNSEEIQSFLARILKYQNNILPGLFGR